VLALWGAWPPNEKVPFKLQKGSCTGGQLATALPYIHWPYNINSTFFPTDATLYVDEHNKDHSLSPSRKWTSRVIQSHIASYIG